MTTGGSARNVHASDSGGAEPDRRPTRNLSDLFQVGKWIADARLDPGQRPKWDSEAFGKKLLIESRLATCRCDPCWNFVSPSDRAQI